MTTESFQFDRFTLDPADRRLRLGGDPVELNGRYLDALALLVRNAGTLVSKDRFLGEVWRGVPVTDEALTQCIKTLRRALGDDAAAPRFIETVPKHGYRFIAPVDQPPASATESVRPSPRRDWRTLMHLGLAGTAGAGAAGIVGGLIYGFVGAPQPLAPGAGAASALVVLVSLTLLLALLGGAGVAFGIAAAGLVPDRRPAWVIAGGAVGGLIVGAVVKLLSLDAFHLLFGQSPGNITGATEGVLLGAAVGLGAWLANRGAGKPRLRRAMTTAGLVGGGAGIVIVLLGGRLMGGSLDQLSSQFPASNLRLDQIGALVGESGFGPISQIVTAAAEGALFAACLVGAMVAARRSLDRFR